MESLLSYMLLNQQKKKQFSVPLQKDEGYLSNDAQNGHVIMVIGEHVNKYLSLNKLGIIKSRSETMPEVGFKRNALR